jgi:hypothetical protein
MSIILLEDAAVTTVTNTIQGNLLWLLIGIGLLILAILLFLLIKHVVVNSILGLVTWGLVVYGFNVQIPFWPSLIASGILGPAGVAIVLILQVVGITL